ncbi:MAG: tetratricopeptide repeat protein, partial [Proteobacteria bacterium]
MKKAVKKTARPPASTAWLEKFKEDVGSFTERGNYKGAMPLVKSALREYPNEFEVKFNYAKILGDWADELPPKQKAKMKAQAVTILKPLLR